MKIPCIQFNLHMKLLKTLWKGQQITLETSLTPSVRLFDPLIFPVCLRSLASLQKSAD